MTPRFRCQPSRMLAILEGVVQRIAVLEMSALAHLCAGVHQRRGRRASLVLSSRRRGLQTPDQFDAGDGVSAAGLVGHSEGEAHRDLGEPLRRGLARRSIRLQLGMGTCVGLADPVPSWQIHPAVYAVCLATSPVQARSEPHDTAPRVRFAGLAVQEHVAQRRGSGRARPAARRRSLAVATRRLQPLCSYSACRMQAPQRLVTLTAESAAIAVGTRGHNSSTSCPRYSLCSMPARSATPRRARAGVTIRARYAIPHDPQGLCLREVASGPERLACL